MAYSITTEDGITIDNIPDTVDPNSNELKARVAKIRASGGEEKPKEQKASTTFGQDLSRQLGLTARAGATGAAGLPLIAGDALNTLINLITGGVGKVTGTEIPQLQMPSRVLQRGLTQSGLPEAETKGEKVIQDITSASCTSSKRIGCRSKSNSTAICSRKVLCRKLTFTNVCCGRWCWCIGCW